MSYSCGTHGWAIGYSFKVQIMLTRTGNIWWIPGEVIRVSNWCDYVRVERSDGWARKFNPAYYTVVAVKF